MVARCAKPVEMNMNQRPAGPHAANSTLARPAGEARENTLTDALRLQAFLLGPLRYVAQVLHPFLATFLGLCGGSCGCDPLRQRTLDSS